MAAIFSRGDEFRFLSLSSVIAGPNTCGLIRVGCTLHAAWNLGWPYSFGSDLPQCISDRLTLFDIGKTNRYQSTNWYLYGIKVSCFLKTESRHADNFYVTVHTKCRHKNNTSDDKAGIMAALGFQRYRVCQSSWRFPRHRLQRKPLVSDLGIYHATCVTHVPWCMSGSLTRDGGEKFPALRNPQFYVSGKRIMAIESHPSNWCTEPCWHAMFMCHKLQWV